VKTNDGELIGKKADCKGKGVLSSRQRFWLIVAAFWLQVVVVIFVVMQFKHRVHTPVTDWMNKIIQLFGG
jgi:hypothetical protein